MKAAEARIFVLLTCGQGRDRHGDRIGRPARQTDPFECMCDRAPVTYTRSVD